MIKKFLLVVALSVALNGPAQAGPSKEQVEAVKMMGVFARCSATYDSIAEVLIVTEKEEAATSFSELGNGAQVASWVLGVASGATYEMAKFSTEQQIESEMNFNRMELRQAFESEYVDDAITDYMNRLLNEQKRCLALGELQQNLVDQFRAMIYNQ